MQKIFIICVLSVAFTAARGQEQPALPKVPGIDRSNLMIRQNSRDYAIIRKGNNHQRMLQIRTEVLLRQRLAIINRRMAMDRRRQMIQQRMIRQQQIRQRMIRQSGPHR